MANPFSLGRVILGLILVPIFALAMLWCYALGPFEADWIEFGYYGQFNQVQRIIRGMPELKILDHWQHHDISMEDFGFEVEMRSGEKRWINFYEKSPQMKLSDDEPIRKFIQSQLVINPPGLPPSFPFSRH